MLPGPTHLSLGREASPRHLAVISDGLQRKEPQILLERAQRLLTSETVGSEPV